MKKVLLTAFAVCITYASVHAQVTIGSDLPPAQGALLDLKNSPSFSTKGLGLPRVALKAIEGDLAQTMGKEANTLDHDQHVGLVVYNITKNEESIEKRFCPGVHVWNGKKWTPLVPYPDITHVGRKLIKVENRGFTYLDPNNPADRWPAGKSNTDYPLGYIGTFTDNRKNDTQQTYNYTRFYVGYKTMDATYEISHNYSCDPNTEVLHSYTETVVEETFDDGVWMTQNLRALKDNDGRSLTDLKGTNPNDYSVSKYYHPDGTQNSQYGVLYNWRTAIGVGTSTGPSEYPATTNADEGGSTHKDIMYRGICPEGWYLPSDQEWTDLANGLAAKSNLFSSLAAGSATEVGYNIDHHPEAINGAGSNLGRVFKTTTNVASYTAGGASKTYNQGGFDSYLVGSGTDVSGNPGAYNYGRAAYFWSSSYKARSKETNVPYGYFRWFLYSNTYYGSANYFRSYHSATNCFSVRCKRIIE